MRRAKEPVPADVTRARGYVDRVRALMEQQKELGAGISDVCTEAKHNAGLDPTVLRFVAREMLMDADKRAERDQKREEYLHAVGLAVAAVEAGEMSARQAARMYSVGKSSVYKALSVRDVSTVEMTEADLGSVEPVREMTADDLGDPDLLDRHRRSDALFRERVRDIARNVSVTYTPPAASPPPDFDRDVGPQPDFLRRTA